MTPTCARVTLSACFLLFIASIAVGPRTAVDRRGPGVGSSRDTELYARVVSRLRANEPFYEVLGSELRQRGYPTVPVFNWRTPLFFVMLRSLSPFTARALLGALAVVLLGMSLSVLAGRRLAAIFLTLTMLVGAVVAVLVPEAIWLSEGWVGILIGLSVCLYRRRLWGAAAIVALLALFLRELAAPFVVLCGAIALRNRRWREVTIWGVGVVIYAAFYGWHVHHALAARLPGDFAHADSWLYAGGLRFVLSTLRTNAWLLVAPFWLAPAMLAVMFAAFFRPATSAHTRAALSYLVFFALVGQPFDFYWGLVTAPACALAVADGVEAIPEMVRAAVAR